MSLKCKQIELKKNFFINYYDSGKTKSKFTIIFIHGWGGCLNDWHYQLKHFRKKYRVLAYDMMGHGNSTFEKGYNFKKYLNDLLTFTKKLKCKNVVLVGHSYGSVLCQAATAKIKVKKLVIVGGAANHIDQFEDRLFYMIPYWLMNPIYKRIMKSKKIEAVLKQYFSSSSKDKTVQKFLKYNPMVRLEVLESFRDFNKVDATKWMKKFNKPCLIVVGTEDKVCPPTSSIELYKITPNSKLVIMKDTGHVPFYEKSEEFNKILEKFLN